MPAPEELRPDEGEVRVHGTVARPEQGTEHDGARKVAHEAHRDERDAHRDQGGGVEGFGREPVEQHSHERRGEHHDHRRDGEHRGRGGGVEPLRLEHRHLVEEHRGHQRRERAVRRQDDPERTGTPRFGEAQTDHGTVVLRCRARRSDLPGRSVGAQPQHLRPVEDEQQHRRQQQQPCRHPHHHPGRSASRAHRSATARAADAPPRSPRIRAWSG